MADRPTAVVLEEARRARTAQDQALQQVRSRAALLLTAASISAAILAAAGHRGWLAIVGAVVFLVLVFLVALIHAPITWKETANVDDLVAEHLDPVDSPADSRGASSIEKLERDLAVTTYGNWKLNDAALDHLARLSRWAVVALGVTVAVFVLQLVVTT